MDFWNLGYRFEQMFDWGEAAGTNSSIYISMISADINNRKIEGVDPTFALIDLGTVKDEMQQRHAATRHCECVSDPECL